MLGVSCDVVVPAAFTSLVPPRLTKAIDPPRLMLLATVKSKPSRGMAYGLVTVTKSTVPLVSIVPATDCSEAPHSRLIEVLLVVTETLLSKSVFDDQKLRPKRRPALRMTCPWLPKPGVDAAGGMGAYVC